MDNKARMHAADMDLLRWVIAKADTGLSSSFVHIGVRPLTIDEREALREAIAAELCRNGLQEDSQPNPYGVQLDDLITKLGEY